MRHSLGTAGLFALCGLLAAACGSSSETDGTDSLREMGDADGGPGADDDVSGGGEDDDSSSASDDDGDDVADDDVSSGDDLVVDDDVSSDDDIIGPEGDASVGDDTPTGLPGDGFVSVGTTDGGNFEILCGSDSCQCADGLDNDGDGLADGADSECTGPFDHDEDTFATGIPGDNRDPKWQDCFFDGNSGAGDDGCRYHTDCLTGELDESHRDCSVTEQCRDYCAPLTPPGCDCFGCCEIQLDDGRMLSILASEQCSIENIDDEVACPRCVMTDTCGNECGECEICIGQTIDDLPDSCFETPPGSGGGGPGGSGSGGDGPGGSGNGGSGNGGSGNGGSGNGGGAAGGPSNSGGSPGDDPPPNVCDGGALACGVSDDCPLGQYCSLGCCKNYPAR